MNDQNIEPVGFVDMGIGSFVWSPSLQPYAFRFVLETREDVVCHIRRWTHERFVDRCDVVTADGESKSLLINWAALPVVEVRTRNPSAEFLAGFIIDVFVDDSTRRIQWAVG